MNGAQGRSDSQDFNQEEDFESLLVPSLFMTHSFLRSLVLHVNTFLWVSWDTYTQHVLLGKLPFRNETFTLTSSLATEPLKVSCYDWDRFTRDDVLVRRRHKALASLRPRAHCCCCCWAGHWRSAHRRPDQQNREISALPLPQALACAWRAACTRAPSALTHTHTRHSHLHPQVTVHLSPRGEIQLRLTALNFPENFGNTAGATTYTTTTSYVPMGGGGIPPPT
jgi:hypothetical protein